MSVWNDSAFWKKKQGKALFGTISNSNIERKKKWFENLFAMTLQSQGRITAIKIKNILTYQSLFISDLRAYRKSEEKSKVEDILYKLQGNYIIIYQLCMSMYMTS